MRLYAVYTAAEIALSLTLHRATHYSFVKSSVSMVGWLCLAFSSMNTR